ncbi:hypothetical protein [Caulobacter sp. SSI4214]|uniref:hypothetical protein n=1 Tax=Caulobacter sp. SSI4214 TaxID=2575739 RepID=UPI00143ABADF|nr:hypothetical protein [Caulobacter sp. SSI4214]
MSPLIAAWIGWAVLVIVLALACWKGGRAERYGVAIFLTGALYTVLVHQNASASLGSILLLLGEGAIGGGFLFLALRYMSAWLGVAMLLQGIQFSLHAYYLVGGLARDNTYAMVNNLDSIGVLLCILVGTLLAWRRRRASAK